MLTTDLPLPQVPSALRHIAAFMPTISSEAIVVWAHMAYRPVHERVLSKAVHRLILFLLLKQGLRRASRSIIRFCHDHSFWILSGWAALDLLFKTLQFILTVVIVVNSYMFGLSPSIVRLLEWVLDFALSKRDFIDFFVDKVGENCNSFTILSINNELTTAGVLVEGDKRPPIRLCHYVKLLLDDVDVRGLYRVRVPNIVGINDKLGRNLAE